MKILTVVFVFAFAQTAVAQDRTVRDLTRDLGAVIGSEDFCKLTLDQAAISAYVEANIPADAIDFPENLNMAVLSAQLYFDGMSASTKVAYCTGMTRSAKAFGLAK